MRNDLRHASFKFEEAKMDEELVGALVLRQAEQKIASLTADLERLRGERDSAMELSCDSTEALQRAWEERDALREQVSRLGRTVQEFLNWSDMQKAQGITYGIIGENMIEAARAALAETKEPIKK